MPRTDAVEGYVKKVYATQQEVLKLLQDQVGEWEKHVFGTLASQRAARAWAEAMLGLIRNLVATSEDLGSMRRLLATMRFRDGRVRVQKDPELL